MPARKRTRESVKHVKSKETAKATNVPNSRKRKRSNSDRKSGKKRNISAYKDEFVRILMNCGVYPLGYPEVDTPPEPGNIQDLEEMLTERRPSFSLSEFSDNNFKTFRLLNQRAKSEATAMARIIPLIAGSGDALKVYETDILFNNLHNFNDSLTAPKPDLYYGARPKQIDLRVRQDLDQFITPSTRTDLPAAPNFFLEGKGASGRADIAQRQAMYDAAAGARGIHALQNYKAAEISYDGSAYTLSSIYHPSNAALHIYATHPVKGDQGRTDYYMTMLGCYAMMGSSQAFCEGAAAYRNARDWAEKQRDRFINEANNKARSLSTATMLTQEGELLMGGETEREGDEEMEGSRETAGGSSTSTSDSDSTAGGSIRPQKRSCRTCR